jgi:hypothetical protein
MKFGQAITALLLGAAGAAALAACGSSRSSSSTPITETVTVTTPAPTTSVQPPTHTTTTPKPLTPAQTRTGPGPAFTRTTGGTPAGGGSGGSGLAAAKAQLNSLGFSPLGTASYHQNQTLRVLLGARTGSADGHTQRAFFFDRDRYLGTDTSDTSGQIAIVSQQDTAVVLRYGLYKSGDADCCPSAGSRSVRFELDQGRLTPVDAIPAAAARR